MRSATSKMSCRLCEMSTTASPCSASRRTSSSTCSRLGDAERGRRLVEDDDAGVPHHRASDRDRLTLAARQARDRLTDRADRRHAKALQRLGRPGLHRRLLEAPETVVDLAAEVHVLHDVEVVAQREVLVDDLDPEPGGVLRPVDRDLLAVEVDLAGVERVDAGDALDQRRLAGAVVADERHDLARAHLEVDVDERLDRAEALRDAARLERRRRRGGRVSASSRRRLRSRTPGLPASAGARSERPRRIGLSYLQYLRVLAATDLCSSSDTR